jgi:hypothetical protein
MKEPKGERVEDRIDELYALAYQRDPLRADWLKTNINYGLSKHQDVSQYLAELHALAQHQDAVRAGQLYVWAMDGVRRREEAREREGGETWQE